MTSFVVSPTLRPLDGRVVVPGDKSIGHRALLFSLLVDGEVVVRGLGDGADNGRSAKAAAMLGAQFRRDGASWIIRGAGLDGLRAPDRDIDCGNSGTTIRLLCGLLAGQRFATGLFGDESLSQRPMRRVIDPLTRMGATIVGVGAGGDAVPPLRVGPATTPLCGIDYAMPMASAQVKSAIVLAALFADGVTKVTEPGPSRDHTERLLRHLGAPIAAVGRTVSLEPGGWNRRLAADHITVPGDVSSSAFLLAAGLVTGGAVRCAGVGVNPTRTGFLDAARAMGGHLAVDGERSDGGEPIAEVSTRAGGDLVATEIAGDLTVRSIDELPILAVLAARAGGTTVIRNAEELRVKESDRIATTCAMLRAFGVTVEDRGDGFAVEGQPDRPLRAALVQAAGDHRIAMAASVAALVADGPSRIDDADNVATSYPGFVAAMRQLGAAIDVITG